MANRKRFEELMNRLEAAEQRFQQREFLAPVVVGGEVRVRIADVVCRMTVSPADFEGYGVFLPESLDEARLVRPAGLAERNRYLELFPKARLILCAEGEAAWSALSAHRGDARFASDSPAAVRFVEDGQPFDVVSARFDGAGFWYEGVESRCDPGAAAYLREAFLRNNPPDQLDRPGLTPEARDAYRTLHERSIEMELAARRNWTEERLREALTHAGAELIEYRERKDGYLVVYAVNGDRHRSSVSKDNLTVQSAGICLDGRDSGFDLHSLVGVIREGRDRNEIFRMDDEL